MVDRASRFTSARKCPVCGGCESDTRGAGKRCTGYLSSDGEWILCTRPERAGAIAAKGQPGAETYAHRRNGECACGVQHGAAQVSDSREWGRGGPPDLIHEYVDENGDLLFQVLRWGTGPGKKVLQRRPAPPDSPEATQGKAWTWSLGSREATRRVLYRLPQLLAADPAVVVHIVEGEKDCDALRKLGLIATTNPHGAGKWSIVAKHAQEVLKGRTCVVIEDDDEPGHAHGAQVAKTLRCPRLTLPDAHDVGDWLGKGGTREALEALVAQARAAHDAKLGAKSNARQAIEVVRGDWTRELLFKSNEDGSEKSSLRPIVANVITILVHDDRWKDVFAYNEFAEWNCTLKQPGWRHQDNGYAYQPGEWTEEDTTRSMSWLSAEYKLDVSADVVERAVSVVCRKRCFHDVRDWGESLKHDGKKRIRSLFQTIFGSEDTEYVRSVATVWLVSTIARIYRPGCKVDTTPVLEGQPGIRKSSVLRALVGDKWFFEMAVGDLSSLDAMQTLRNKIMFEIPEIDKFGNPRHRESAISFLSRQSDRYRASYGRRVVDRPRQCVGVGTTNKEQWITDDTGAFGRRMLPIRCMHGDADSIAYVTENRDQIWAEAIALFKAGERWHFSDPALEELAKEEQEARHVTEPIRQQIAGWVNARSEGALKSRAEYGVTGEDIMRECLQLAAKDRTPAMAMVVGRVMRSLGWTLGRQETRMGIRVRLYRPETTDAAEPPLHLPLPADDPFQPLDDAPSYPDARVDP